MTTWYCRPYGGSYGSANGTSYANAWNGLLAVVWGGSGVVAGDTLYVCGTHILNKTSQDPYDQGTIYPTNGTNDATRVTIRGDYPSDPGIVWGSYYPAYSTWTSEGSGTWSLYKLPGLSGSFDWWQANPAVTSATLLTYVADVATCKTTTNSYTNVAGAGEQFARDSTTYVHLDGGVNPTGLVLFPGYGYSFDNTGGRTYVTYLNISLLGMSNNVNNNNDATHMTWDGVTMKYGQYAHIKIYDGCDYFTVQNCDLSIAANGIYTIADDTYEHPHPGASYYIIKNNYIHDIGGGGTSGNPDFLLNNDEHGLGVQGGQGGLVEGNHFKNCGNSCLFYVAGTQHLIDTIVRYNFVEGAHLASGGAGDSYGISTMIAGYSADRSIKIYYNLVINNPDIAYRLQFQEGQEVYNNIAYHCWKSFSSAYAWSTSPSPNPAVKFRNNISISPTYFEGGHCDFAFAGADSAWDIDYNIYYPDASTAFKRSGHDPMNFATWQVLGYDAHSLVVNPNFINGSGSYSIAPDFEIGGSSPAHTNPGVDVGLIRDYFNNLVTAPPDRGIHQYSGGSSATAHIYEGIKVKIV